ncbi:MAG: serine/threonine protein kinase [Phycisphaeraceae bacterium]|nr:serine/threonine protein kinase [Phycisphaeraceae bacterium]
MSEDSPTIDSPAPSTGAGRPSADQFIGRYRVVSLLGEGGFGEVYLAEQQQPIQRRVALKVIKPGMDSRAVLARFEAERQALAMMDHPGVAKVFDAGVSESGRPFFAMELVPGAPINRFCREGRLSVEDRVSLMVQVCEAVQHAHMKGVIHRDLKPANVLVATVDGRPTAKVIDFGVAKALHRPLTDASMVTEAGQMIGTPEYMSPEQARGSLMDVDTRADVYSLGAILYELLTGVPPLDSRELRRGGYAHIQRTIEETQPLRPSERVTTLGQAPSSGPRRDADQTTLSRRLREDLDWIVLKCLEKERARRYDSAGALGRDLQRYLNDEPVLACPPSVGYRARKFVRRHRGAVAAAAGIGVALIIGLIGTSVGLSWALHERANARSQADAAVKARDEAERVTTFLSDMLESVDPGIRGRDVTVRAILDHSAGSLSAAFADAPLVEARLRHTIGNAYVALGLLAEADQQLPRALEIRKRVLGETHADTLRLTSNLGALRLAQGRLDEAERLFKQADAGFASIGNRSGSLGARNNIALIQARRGNIEAAASVQREVVDGYRHLLGPDHERTLGCSINLASMCEELGRLEEAMTLLNQAVEGFRRTRGPEDPRTLLAEYNLAGLYRRTGKVSEGGTLARHVLEVRERVLGQSHPQTIAARSLLGLFLRAAGRMDDAERETLAALTAARRVLGDSHGDTVRIAGDLLGLYEVLDWPDRSSVLAEEVLPIIRRAAEGDNATPDDLNTYGWYLLTLQPERLRDPSLALQAAQRAVERDTALGGHNLWQYLDTLAMAQARTGDPVAAAKSQRRAVDLLPQGQQRYREEMESRLKEYERAAGPP